MKSVLVIGLGRFGQRLTTRLLELGNEVMIIDSEEEPIEELLPYVTSAKIGDCTKPEVLESLGVANFDVVFVCIGTNFQSSLEITSMVKEMGAKHVVSKATRDIQAKFLLRNGADEVVYPERDFAVKCAERFSMDDVFDYIELTDDYGIYEILPMKEWVGRSIRESGIAAKYKVSIIGIKEEGQPTIMQPSPDVVIKESQHLIVLASHKVAAKLTGKRRSK